MSKLDDTTVVAWIPETTIAKTCQREYIALLLEMSKLSFIRPFELYIFMTEFDFQFESLKKDDSLEVFYFTEEEENILKKSNYKIFRLAMELRDEFKKQTGMSLEIVANPVDAWVYVNGSVWDLRKVFLDENTINWVTTAAHDFCELAKLDAYIVSYEY